MTDLEELRRLKGIRIVALDMTAEDTTRAEWAMVFTDEPEDFWEDEPGLVSGIKRNSYPLTNGPLDNSTLARWNRKCETWLPTVRQMDRAIFWGGYLLAMVCVLIWMFRKAMGW